MSVILVLDVSRWGRFQDIDESAYYEFICKSAGIPVHYCAEPFTNDLGMHKPLLELGMQSGPLHQKYKIYLEKVGVAQVVVIEVSDWLIEHTQELRIQLGETQIPCRSGKQLGSLYVGPEHPGLSLDYLPETLLERVVNVSDFARVLVLDKWTCNADGRQAVFCQKRPRSRRYNATFIDQGYCFNASEWNFPDYPLRGVYATNCVYQGVTGWGAFEPALSKAEEMDSEAIWQCAADIPEEWYEGDRDGLHRLIETLYKRRCLIRRLISIFRESARNPFPNWRDAPTFVDLSSVRRDEAVEIR